MRPKTMLFAVVLGVAGAVLPASAASACITVYLPVIGSPCSPCGFVERTYATADSTAGGALPGATCPR